MKKFIVWPLCAVMFVVVSLASALGYAQYRASQIDLPPLKIGDSSQVLASDGKTQLGSISAAGSDHKSLTEAQVSSLIRQAHLSAEDRGFYQHGAISLPNMARALLTDAKSGSLAAGGSTITQQYVKNAYLTQQKTADRKANEIVYAYRVEKDFTKDEILTKYVNSTYYGRGAYGVDDASWVWFGVSATSLKDQNNPLQVARAAFLAAIINQPSDYDDFIGRPSHLVYRKALDERQRYVLDGMRQLKGVNPMVSQDVIDRAKRLIPLKLTDTLKRSGRTTSDNSYLVSYINDWLVAWQTQVAIQDGFSAKDAAEKGQSMAEAMLARGGLRIVTSIDADLQKQLKTAAQNQLPDQGLANGDVIMDPRTGGIVAMYSGSARKGDTQNYALYADRQVGSIMKTVVLADVVRSGISVSSELPAPAYVSVDGSRIYNDDHSAARGCRLSIADAIAQSNNPVNVELITGKMASCHNPALTKDIESGYPVSPKSVANLARRIGADDSLVPGRTNPAKLPEVPTLALGVGTMSPVKVATIGSTFANNGTHTTPHLLDTIIAVNGETVYQNQSTATRVLGEHESAIVNQTLRGVFTHGTAVNNQVPGYPMAGKTGTTSTDAWGLMYSAVDPRGNAPAYVCASWAGYPDNRRTADNLWGSTVMRICESFFRQALDGKPRVDFSPASLGSGQYVGLSVDTRAETPEKPTPTSESPHPSPTSESPTPTPTPETPLPSYTKPVTEPTTENPSPSPSPSLSLTESPNDLPDDPPVADAPSAPELVPPEVRTAIQHPSVDGRIT